MLNLFLRGTFHENTNDMRLAKSKSAKIRVGAVQLISDRDVAGNVERALMHCDQAAKQGVQILCFPECATMGKT